MAQFFSYKHRVGFAFYYSSILFTLLVGESPSNKSSWLLHSFHPNNFVHSVTYKVSYPCISHLEALLITLFCCGCFLFLYPPLQSKLKGGMLFSPCPSVSLSMCPSVHRTVSALYLQQYSSDPVPICTSYQATSEGASPVKFVSTFEDFKFCKII